MERLEIDQAVAAESVSLGLLDVALLLAQNARLLLIGPLVAGIAALGATYLIAPTYTAATTFLPPQQQQSAAASALSSLGALSGLAGVAGGPQDACTIGKVTVVANINSDFSIACLKNRITKITGFEKKLFPEP